MVFEYPTNYSNGTVVDGVGKFFIDYPNTIIDGYANGLVFLIWMVLFAVTSFAGMKKSIAATCFITGMISVYFAVRGWINPVIPIGLIIFAIVGALGAKQEGSL